MSGWRWNNCGRTIDYIGWTGSGNSSWREYTGLSYREALLLMEILAGTVYSMDIVVELNLILDNRNATGEIAVKMAANLFGQ